MWALINPSRIIKEHFKSLEQDAGRFPRYTIFFLMPLLVSFFLVVCLQKPLTHQVIAVLVPAFSIFTALLLNVAFLLLNNVSKLSTGPADKQSLKGRLVSSLYVNSLYSILVSTIILTVLILIAIAQPWMIGEYVVNLLVVSAYIPSSLILLPISFIAYFLIMHFILNLLMVIKRLHGLLVAQVSTSK